MCLIALAWRRRPETPLLLLANRGEQHARPTAGLAFWEDAPEVCAGRDLQEGGTWLGVTRGGRFAAITNFREPRPVSGGPSRGQLVADFLRGENHPLDFARQIAGDRYAGFNLLLGTADGDLVYRSNRDAGGPRVLPPGDYGLSNGLLDDDWPKLCSARDGLTELLDAGERDPEAYFSLMASDQAFPDQSLPDTGIGQEFERLLSPRFIRTPSYGTRCTTILAVGPRRVRIRERRFDPAGRISGEDEERFVLAGRKRDGP